MIDPDENPFQNPFRLQFWLFDCALRPNGFYRLESSNFLILSKYSKKKARKTLKKKPETKAMAIISSFCGFECRTGGTAGSITWKERSSLASSIFANSYCCVRRALTRPKSSR